jgi:hypothetical protein
MCGPIAEEADTASQTAAMGAFAGSAQALAATRAGLSWLSRADVAELPASELAGCLRELERAESALTAARASVLGAFTARAGQAEDGHGSARTWLAWQTRITKAAAAGAVGWARQLCDWSDRLPADRRADADTILTGAAAAGAGLDGLAVLAEEMYRRCAPPDADRGDVDDRRLVLDRTFGGAGRLTGDLSPRCAAALAAVLESLGAKAGPEDTRDQAQRDHDALEEACRRLLGAGCLPDRAGQPAQLRLHMTLDQLRGQPGAAAGTAAWPAGEAPAAPGHDCDAQLAPQVDGHLDPAALDRLTTDWIRRHLSTADANVVDPPAAEGAPAATSTGQPPPGLATARTRLDPATVARIRSTLLRQAVDALSGPTGLAAYLRTGLLPGPAGSPSLPLDLGRVTEIIPPHLRRAVTSRDKRCRFPGCRQAPAWCQVHHLVPRSKGGGTALASLILLCPFHHLIAVHQWGWQLTLHPDGTVTATSPDRTRLLHDHGPPTAA